MKNKLILALTISVLTCWAEPRPEHRKLAPDFDKVDAFSNVRVIVQWKKDPANEHHKVFSHGGSLHSVHHSINAGTYTVPAYALADLANDPDVKYIAPDRPLKAKLDYTAAAMNAAAVWNAGWSGKGVGVAVIDSGINADPNLGGPDSKGIVYSYDFVGKDGHDQYGHGQHVSGIIAANGQSSSCPSCNRVFKGIAPGVNLIDLRVLDANGSGTDDEVIAALEMAISLKDKYNIRVINLSLGRPVYESYTQDPLCQAVEAAWKAGIVVVAAAGNDGRDNTFGEQGYGTITAPGNDPYVITVGAMKAEATYDRTDDLIASYSSKGPTQIDHIVKPDVVAPGNQVVSLLAANSTLANEASGAIPLSYYKDVPAPPAGPTTVNAQGADNGDGKKVKAQAGSATLISNNYLMLSGTSMATAAVSGAAADLIHANPNLTPDQVKLLLMQTAYKTFPQSSTVVDSTGVYVDYYDVFTVGAGYVDLAAALAAINSVPAGVTALSPVANYDASSGNVTLAFDPTSAWSTQPLFTSGLVDPTKCLWGAQSVWGSSVLAGTKCLWGAQCVWGASVLNSTKCLWGAQAIWGAEAIWSNSAGAGESAPVDER